MPPAAAIIHIIHLVAQFSGWQRQYRLPISLRVTIPPFNELNEHGFLPEGVHDCTMSRRYAGGVRAVGGLRARRKVFSARSPRIAVAQGSAATSPMIENDEQLKTAYESLGRLYRTLAALRREILPVDPQQYARFAERPLEEVRKHRAAIEAYLGLDEMHPLQESPPFVIETELAMLSKVPPLERLAVFTVSAPPAWNSTPLLMTTLPDEAKLWRLTAPPMFCEVDIVRLPVVAVKVLPPQPTMGSGWFLIRSRGGTGRPTVPRPTSIRNLPLVSRPIRRPEPSQRGSRSSRPRISMVRWFGVRIIS